MEKSVKTNRLAIASFVCGLLVISFWVLYPIFQSVIYNLELYYTVVPLGALTIVGPLAGAFALIQIKKKKGTEKGIRLAWLGIVLPLGWPIFQLILLFAIFGHGF
jgi:uncharacterized protein with PQ loop repeat